MPDVFISYSRLDREFVRTLHEALVGAGRSDWVDWRDIPPTAEWLGEIVRAIHASDAFVFVITPHSAASDVCRQELAEAARQHKRIVPVLRQPVDASALPDPLPRLNWIPFQKSDDFDAAVGLLLTALDLDLDWVRSHTRLLLRAVEWDEHGRENSFTLRGNDLDKAEHWLERGSSSQPPPTALQTEYILASRRSETRRQRALLTAVSVALVLTIALALAAWYQRQQAIARRFVSIAQALAAAAETELQQGRHDERAALLARQAYVYNQRYSGERIAQIDAVLRLVLGATNPAMELGPVAGEGELTVVARSRTGQWLAAADNRGRVHVWDTDNRTRDAHVLPQKTGAAVVALVFSPSEDLLAGGTEDGDLQLWDIQTGRERLTLRPGKIGAGITAAAFDRQGRVLAAGTRDGTVYLVTLHTNPPSVRRCCRAAGPIQGIAFQPGSAATIIGGTGDGVVIWDAESGRVIRTLKPPRPGAVKAIAVRAESGHIAAGLAQRIRMSSLLEAAAEDRDPEVTVEPGVVIVWDASGSRHQVLEGHQSSISGVTFLADGRLVSAGGADGLVQLWTLGSEPRAARLEPRLREATAVASYSPRSSVAVADGVRRVVRVWNLGPPPGAPRELRGHLGGIAGLAFAPAGDRLAAAATDDGTVSVWDLATGREGFPFGPRPAAGTAVAFSPDGRFFASGSRPNEGSAGVIRLWDTLQPRLPPRTLPVHASPVRTIDFDPRGELIVSAGRLDRQLTIRDVRQLSAPPRLLELRFDEVVAARFGAGGGYLAWISSAPEVRVWNRDRPDAEPARLPCDIASFSALAFSRNSATVAAGGADGHVCLWEIGSSPHRVIQSGEAIVSLALDDSGKQLAAGSQSGVVRLWDLDHLDWAPRTLTGLPSRVTALAFAPGGTLLAGGSDASGRPVLLWPSTASLAAAVCNHSRRLLTTEEWHRFIGRDVSEEATCPIR